MEILLEQSGAKGPSAEIVDVLERVGRKTCDELDDLL